MSSTGPSRLPGGPVLVSPSKLLKVYGRRADTVGMKHHLTPDWYKTAIAAAKPDRPSTVDVCPTYLAAYGRLTTRMVTDRDQLIPVAARNNIAS